jgi:hypothetical protein
MTERLQARLSKTHQQGRLTPQAGAERSRDRLAWQVQTAVLPRHRGILQEGVMQLLALGRDTAARKAEVAEILEGPFGIRRYHAPHGGRSVMHFDRQVGKHRVDAGRCSSQAVPDDPLTAKAPQVFDERRRLTQSLESTKPTRGLCRLRGRASRLGAGTKSTNI